MEPLTWNGALIWARVDEVMQLVRIATVLSALVCLATPAAANSKENPCNTPDPGDGVYMPWSRDVSMGQILLPRGGGITPRGGFDLLIHFHGHEAVRKQFVPVGGGIVMVGIDLGIGGAAYANAFGSPNAFEDLLASIRTAVAKHHHRKRAFIRRLALSSWSAGYGAIDQILRQPVAKKIDAVILLDSLYAGYEDASRGALKERAIEPFVEFARSAARGRRFMYQSHSRIRTHGYATTREVSQYVVKHIGGKLRETRRKDRLGLWLTERFDRRGYHVRGYEGDNKAEHCGHIGIIRDVVKVHLRRRWRTPRAYIPRTSQR